MRGNERLQGIFRKAKEARAISFKQGNKKWRNEKSMPSSMRNLWTKERDQGVAFERLRRGHVERQLAMFMLEMSQNVACF